MKLSIIRPREEVQAGALPYPHRLPSCLPPPLFTDPDRASQTLCSPGWERLGGFPGEEVPLLHAEGKGLSPGFRSTALAFRVPCAPPPLDLGSPGWAFPPLFACRRLPGLLEADG